MRITLLAALVALPVLCFAAPSQPNVQAETGEEPHAHSPGDRHPHVEKTPDADAQPFGKNENNTDYFWRKSDEAFHAGDYSRAIGLHKAIVALDPGDTESFGVAAWLIWSLGEKENAIIHIKRGLDLNPTNAEMWNEAGQHFDLQKKLPEAKEAYFNAVKFAAKEDDTNMLRRRLAHAAEKAGDVKLSLETWQGLAGEFPNDVVIKNNLARVLKLSPLSLILGRKRTKLADGLNYSDELGSSTAATLDTGLVTSNKKVLPATD